MVGTGRRTAEARAGALEGDLLLDEGLSPDDLIFRLTSLDTESTTSRAGTRVVDSGDVIVTDGHHGEAEVNFSATEAKAASLLGPNADVPIVTVSGVDYYEFILDVNEADQKGIGKYISLDEVQIFVGGTHVGGFDDLYALESAGRLDRLLADASS